MPIHTKTTEGVERIVVTGDKILNSDGIACCCTGSYKPWLRGYSCGATANITVDWSNVKFQTFDNNGCWNETGHECEDCKRTLVGGVCEPLPCDEGEITSENACNLGDAWVGSLTWPTYEFAGIGSGDFTLCVGTLATWEGDPCGDCTSCGCGYIEHVISGADCDSLVEDAYMFGGNVRKMYGDICNRVYDECCDPPNQGIRRHDLVKNMSVHDNNGLWRRRGYLPFFPFPQPNLLPPDSYDKSYCARACERHESRNEGWQSNALMFTRSTPIPDWTPSMAITDPWVRISLRTLGNIGFWSAVSEDTTTPCADTYGEGCDSCDAPLTSEPGGCFHPTSPPVHIYSGIPYLKWVSIQVDDTQEYTCYGTQQHYAEWANSPSNPLSDVVTVTTDQKKFWFGLRVPSRLLDPISGLLIDVEEHPDGSSHGVVSPYHCDNIQGFKVHENECAGFVVGEGEPGCGEWCGPHKWVWDNSDEWALESMDGTHAVFRARYRYWYRCVVFHSVYSSYGAVLITDPDVCCPENTTAGCGTSWSYWGSAVDGTACDGVWTGEGVVVSEQECDMCCQSTFPCVSLQTRRAFCNPDGCNSLFAMSASWRAGGIMKYCGEDGINYTVAGDPKASIYDVDFKLPTFFRMDTDCIDQSVSSCVPCDVNMGPGCPTVAAQNGGYPSIAQ